MTVGKHYFRRIYYTTTGIVCEESSNVLLIEVREKPTLNAPGNNGPLCEGQDLQLQVPALAGATYAWTGPNTLYPIFQNPVINSVGMIHAGQYRVVADVNGCSSNPQFTDVAVIAKPATPQITSNSPVCEGADIEISVLAVSGAIYEWSGPAGVISGNEK